jgi:hypothetical protein
VPSRRDALRTTAAAGAGLWLCRPAEAAGTALAGEAAPGGLYATLLRTWCDRLLELQVAAPGDPSRDGALSCPACSFLHGRCADAVYPLLHLARTSGESRYVDAAVRLQRWSDNVSEPDGAFRNDVEPGSWKGITVFAVIALAEALHHHGALLEAAVRQRWRERLASATRFLDGFVTMQTGNINYPVTSALAFTLAADVLDLPRYRERGRALAHASLAYLTPGGLLFGEGHPQDGRTARGCRAVDLGYNVEESLPALALYGLQARDAEVTGRVAEALRAHLEFLLPDGGWDNGWGTRQFKWTWWGSRTSDGCQPAYALLAARDPRFAEAALRNLEQLAACTHDGLLHGGPHYRAQGVPPCVHHTFTHAKALATVLDRGGAPPVPAVRPRLPRDEAYGLRHFPEIATWLAAVGEWRATVTACDWEYKPSGGGHPSGGALSLLHHQRLGPVLVASMTEYQLWEAHNQQVPGDWPTMPLTPRIEAAGATSLSDLAAAVTARHADGAVVMDAAGRLQTTAHADPASGPAGYRLGYRFDAEAVTIDARSDVAGRLVLPIVCTQQQPVARAGARVVHVGRDGGRLVAECDAPSAFEPVPERRVFNLVPGFQCVPLAVALAPGRGVRVRIRALPS